VENVARIKASDGFPPVSLTDAKVLVLGSLPGRRSIAEQQYYAHPQNAFWPIMRELFDIAGSYKERCNQLAANRIALWDVLASSIRPGSMDADIRVDSAQVNNFGRFMSTHKDIQLIAFNGKKAHELFERLVDIQAIAPAVQRVVLPSTSPAYAMMPYSGKLDA